MHYPNPNLNPNPKTIGCIGYSGVMPKLGVRPCLLQSEGEIKFSYNLPEPSPHPYLYSLVNSISWNLLSTSLTPFVGLANIGLSGMPAVSLA